MTFRGLRRLWPLAAVVALLVVAALSAVHATPQLGEVPSGAVPEQESRLDQPAETPNVDAPPVGPVVAIGLPGWLPGLLRALLFLLIAATVLAVLWSLLRRLLRREAALDGGPEAVPQLVRPDDAAVLAAVDAGLADLSDSDRDPRRAVIACWLRLEEAAVAAGIPRQPADTATDLVVRLLSGSTGARVVSAGVLARFAEAYREARYATHPIDERMREQARAALHRLRAELTSPAAR